MILIKLERMAILEITKALNDPARSLSDHTIGAIAHMANFERGSQRENLRMHLAALKTIGNERGGWYRLHLHSPLHDYLTKIGLYSMVEGDAPLWFELLGDVTSTQNAPRGVRTEALLERASLIIWRSLLATQYVCDGWMPEIFNGGKSGAEAMLGPSCDCASGSRFILRTTVIENRTIISSTLSYDIVYTVFASMLA